LVKLENSIKRQINLDIKIENDNNIRGEINTKLSIEDLG